jgi:hypothetical protein
MIDGLQSRAIACYACSVVGDRLTADLVVCDDTHIIGKMIRLVPPKSKEPGYTVLVPKLEIGLNQYVVFQIAGLGQEARTLHN